MDLRFSNETVEMFFLPGDLRIHSNSMEGGRPSVPNNVIGFLLSNKAQMDIMHQVATGGIQVATGGTTVMNVQRHIIFHDTVNQCYNASFKDFNGGIFVMRNCHIFSGFDDNGTGLILFIGEKSYYYYQKALLGLFKGFEVANQLSYIKYMGYKPCDFTEGSITQIKCSFKEI